MLFRSLSLSSSSSPLRVPLVSPAPLSFSSGGAAAWSGDERGAWAAHVYSSSRCRFAVLVVFGLVPWIGVMPSGSWSPELASSFWWSPLEPSALPPWWRPKEGAGSGESPHNKLVGPLDQTSVVILSLPTVAVAELPTRVVSFPDREKGFRCESGGRRWGS